MNAFPTLAQFLAQRNKLICAQYESGRSLQDVGNEHGITRERIRQILVRAGIDERHEGFNMPRRVAYRAKITTAAERAKERKEKTAATRARVRELYDAGATYDAIAAEVGIVKTNVQQHVWATGGPSRTVAAKRTKRRITPEQAKTIGARYASGESVETLATEFGIVPGYVPLVANRHGFYRAWSAKRGFAPIDLQSNSQANGDAT